MVGEDSFDAGRGSEAKARFLLMLVNNESLFTCFKRA